MPRDPRAFITVVDTMPEHPKAEQLTDAAFRLLIELWCWCRRVNNDGRISGTSWERRGTVETRAELLRVGWAEVQGNDTVVMHDYAEHQQTAADRAALSATRAEAGRAGGLAKAAKRQAASQASATAPAETVANPGNPLAGATADAKQNSGKVEVEVEVEVETLRGSEASNALANARREAAGQSAQTLVAEWIDHLGPTGRPPSAVVGQVAKRAGAMLTEGIPYDDVRRGLQQWQLRGPLHPSALDSMVHEVRTATAQRSTARPGGLDLDQARRDAQARQEARP